MYGKGINRPRVHGEKIKLNDPETWWTPDQMVEVKDPKLGWLRLRLWCKSPLSTVCHAFNAFDSSGALRAQKLQAQSRAQREKQLIIPDLEWSLFCQFLSYIYLPSSLL